MALTEEQREFIKQSNDRGPDANGHRSTALEIVAAGQFLGVDFASVDEIEALLRELRGER